MPLRRTFKMEFEPGKSISIVLEGKIDDGMIEALEGYVARNRKRLTLYGAISPPAPELPNGEQ